MTYRGNLEVLDDPVSIQVVSNRDIRVRQHAKRHLSDLLRILRPQVLLKAS